jgi:hypothetical protein
MRSIKYLTRRTAAGLAAVTAAGGLALSLGLGAASAATAASHAGGYYGGSFSFDLVPASPAVAKCLPDVRGRVTITRGQLNDTMRVSVYGLPRYTGLALFVIQQPTFPFGVSSFVSDVDAGRYGSGSVTVRGIFDDQTFSLSPGGTAKFSPTHQYHLGLWFENPSTPFNLGCEPGATAPVVTPFSGNQHAGILALNTAEFPANAGPLSHVHR